MVCGDYGTERLQAILRLLNGPDCKQKQQEREKRMPLTEQKGAIEGD